MWAFGCLVAVAMVTVAWSRSNPRARATYCGSELADALALVCDNTYYGGFIRDERSIHGYKDRKNALAFLGRRRRSGIVDECCRKTCSVPELQTYCSSEQNI